MKKRNAYALPSFSSNVPSIPLLWTLLFSGNQRMHMWHNDVRRSFLKTCQRTPVPREERELRRRRKRTPTLGKKYFIINDYKWAEDNIRCKIWKMLSTKWNRGRPAQATPSRLSGRVYMLSWPAKALRNNKQHTGVKRKQTRKGASHNTESGIQFRL